MARRKTRAKKPKDAVYDPVSTALGMTDVLERVLTFVEKPADVVKSALVSKAFRKVCNSTALWKARAAHHKPKAEEYPFLDDETIDELLDNANDEMFTFCEKLIREYCYFLTCCRDTEKVSYRGKTLSPSPLVDLVWHEHILATKEYMKFCDEVFGAYLHHTPGDYDIEFYENTIEAYDRCIGKPRSSDIWPEPDDLEELWFGSDQSGMDCG